MRVKRLFSSENCGGGKYMSTGVVSFVLVFRFTIVYLPMLCANISREEQKQRGKIVMEMWKCELKKFESFFFASLRPVLSENVFCVVCRRRFCAPVYSMTFLEHFVYCVCRSELWTQSTKCKRDSDDDAVE